MLLCYSLVQLVVLHRLMDIAKEMTREALPIKCLEAVILGMYPYSSRCFMCFDVFELCCCGNDCREELLLFTRFSKFCSRFMSQISLTLHCTVTSPTICQVWSASPSAFSLSSQGTTSTTSCSESTAGGALARWASAGGRTSCSSPWSSGH